ncbi:Xylose isomerase-like TIM barrel [Aquisphaera giovannonii]|uniref:Xylose isomerase-like TIM barrel n=1 Tax=Aquisphaera giovannonii TaxID=406548 RepID=A0A5B9W3I6_9BACT|nr:TIM barrel protein [Aquisphaera giovannonii]QEH35176.1 Xylose isomerase-like TIM barrel [Aquisphaera giovannonii]
MRLGIGSYTYGWAVGTAAGRPEGALTARDLLRRAIALGVRVLQLCDNLPESTWEADELAALGAEARRAGVEVQVGTRGSQPGHLRRFIAVARAVGSPILRLVIDAPGDEPDAAEVVRRLDAVSGDLERAGVVLALENHDRFRAAALAAIVRQVGRGCVGVCLDTVNSFGALEGPEAVVETLGPLAVNLHLKDFDVVRLPHLQGFLVEGRPLGGGRLDVPWLLGRLRAFGRDPDAILEQWTPPEGSPGRTIEKEAAWAEAGVRAARRWIHD